MASADNAIGSIEKAGEGGMQWLRAITIGMGVLILIATTVLVVVIVRRLSGPGPEQHPIALTLNEPAGTRIAGIAPVGDQLAALLQGGGTDRIVLINLRTGAMVGSVALQAGQK